MKKIISFVIALTTVLSCLAMISCAENATKDPSGETGPEEERRWLDDIPEDLTLEGSTVTFVGHHESGAFDAGLAGTYVEEDTGDSVDTALYESVESIKKRFSVDLEFLDVPNTLTNSIKSQLMAGDSDYDILAGYGYYDIGLATDGYLLDLNSLADLGIENYINHQKSYWFTQYVEGITYLDNMYWLVGDISTLTLGCMYVTFVNTEIYERTCLDRYGSIYDIVTSGGWNLDLLCEMAALGYTDTNGNDKIDLGDVVGWGTCWVDVVDGMSMAAGFEYSQKQADGSISITVNTNPHNVNVITKLAGMVSTSYSYRTANDEETMLEFKSGNVFFTVNDLRLAEIYLREMETDYYIIPTPKYDANQADYRTAIHDEYTLFGISYASDAVYEASIVLEALCAEHSKTVRPKYYDEALKYKYTRDDGSADMIDIVRDSVYTDFIFAWTERVNAVTHAMRNLPPKPASLFRKNEKTWNTAFTTLLESLSD